MRRSARWVVGGVLVGILALVTAPTAHASPPANDNFADADVVATLPFTDSGDLATTTIEPGEPPSFCVPGATRSAWYTFTPAASGAVEVDLTGSDFGVAVAAFQSSGGGLGGLTFVGCGNASPGARLVVSTTAATTYYLQVSEFGFGGTHLELRMATVSPPANDAFADATPLSGTPTNATVDLTAATLEAGEPTPAGITTSAWYAFTTEVSGTVLVRSFSDPATQITVYTGSSLGGLTQVATGSGPFPPITFPAIAGTTYYVQVGRSAFFPGGSSAVTFTIETPGTPIAAFFAFPFDPSTFDTVQFIDTSLDPAFIGFGPAQWDLGDGTTASGCCPSHRYAADGDYTVVLNVTTFDGRTATTSQVLQVRTHDVSIERIQAPNTARVGQTKDVKVKVRGGRYPETVQVDLFKSGAGGEQFVGTQAMTVPAAQGGRTTEFGFTATFTSDDATAGKVTFRAVANIVGARDALPADNQAIAPPTDVKR